MADVTAIMKESDINYIKYNECPSLLSLYKICQDDKLIFVYSYINFCRLRKDSYTPTF